MVRLTVFLQAFVPSFLFINFAFADSIAATQYPLYRDGTLTIPSVDTAEQAGRFQNMKLQFNAANNTWSLLDYIESIVTPGKGVYIDKVETIVIDSSPAQVFVKVTGSLPDPCYSIGQINQRWKDGKFEITLHSFLMETLVACADVLAPFEKIIPLEVYGLSAGNYEYRVNGEHIGSFSLSVDNNL